MIKIAGKTMNKRGYIALATLIMITVGIVLSINFVKADNVEEQPGDFIGPSVLIEENILDDNLKEIDVVVRNGDTAWDIQSELTPNEDVNAIIAQLEELNNVNLESINSGDIIKFAIYK